MHAHFVGHGAGFQLRHPAGHLPGLALLALDRGQRRLEVFFRCGLIAALAALVEIHRCRMQLQRHGGNLGRRRLVTEIFLRHVLAAEFRIAAHFPEKVGLDDGGQLFRFGEQSVERRLVAQHHRVCLDLAALAADGFDLQRGTDIGHDVPYLEAAVFFVEHVHGNCRCKPLRSKGAQLYRSRHA